MKKSHQNEPMSKLASRKDRIRRPGNLRMSDEVKCREIPITAADLSPRGTFENLSIHFPEGGIINLRFRLEQSKGKSWAQSDKIYRLAGIGIGLEFVGLRPEAVRGIEKELIGYIPPQLSRIK